MGVDMEDRSPEKPSLYHLRIAWERRKALEEAERRKQSEMEEKERERQELEVQIMEREQEEERMRVMEAELVSAGRV
jgi:C4-dicarboxylate-specific signal transduction histidine kinase